MSIENSSFEPFVTIAISRRFSALNTKVDKSGLYNQIEQDQIESSTWEKSE